MWTMYLGIGWRKKKIHKLPSPHPFVWIYPISSPLVPRAAVGIECQLNPSHIHVCVILPDVFRGCLFYGPPGTGKTLVARALANECSQGERKLSFFMRKGADCLSKWVGESERQLRLLFDQVNQAPRQQTVKFWWRLSVIFFLLLYTWLTFLLLTRDQAISKE